MIFGLMFIPFSVNIAMLLGVLAALSIGSGLNNPTVLSLISLNSSPEEQGGILGINQSLGSLARVLGPLWGGFTFETFGHQYPFVTGGAFMVIAFLMSLRLLGKNSRAKSPAM
jgi:MFS family permease